MSADLIDRSSMAGPRRLRLPVGLHWWVLGLGFLFWLGATPSWEPGASYLLVPAVFLFGVLSGVAALSITRPQVGPQAGAAARRDSLHALLSQAPAAMAILRGPELRFELSNPMNQALCGDRPVVGRPIGEVLPEFRRQRFLERLEEVYRTGRSIVYREAQVELDAPEGLRRMFLNGVCQPFRGPTGEVEGVMVFSYDVTEQVKARQQVEELAASLRQAVRTRDEFLSVAGHELKTPLAALKLQLQGLMRHCAHAPSPQLSPIVERLGRAERHTQRLARLVDELLDVSRITGGRMELQLAETDLVEVVREVVDRLSEPLARSGCTLEQALPPQLWGNWDPGRLDQVLTNVLSNAIKYGRGKPIRLAVRRKEDAVEILIRDQGIGISPEHRRRIFGRFERAVSERHYGGLGLGLWISHQIVQAHAGRISLMSSPGEGSTFIVELPLPAGKDRHREPGLRSSRTGNPPWR